MEILETKIPKHIFQRLENAQIYSLQYFLLNSENEICNNTKLSKGDVRNLINIVSEITLNFNFVTAYELKNQEIHWKILNIGCPIIDKKIGGVPTKGITEIYGESGTGKTQICLQLALQVQKLEKYGGLNAGAIYICTEDNFPSKRLEQMSEFLTKSLKENQKNYSDEIFIEHIQDVEQLKYCIAIRIPVLLSKTKIKLIIIDSIAATFRYDNEASDYIIRSDDLRFLATKLNNLATYYNIAIVCINQITSDPILGEKPCLGLSWSNLVRKRLKLYRNNINITYNKQILPLRSIKVIFSPDTSSLPCLFIVTKNGILGYK